MSDDTMRISMNAWFGVGLIEKYIPSRFVYPPGTDRVMTTEVVHRLDPQPCQLIEMDFQIGYHEEEELQRHYDNHMYVPTPKRSCPISSSRMGQMAYMRHRCENSRRYDKYGGEI